MINKKITFIMPIYGRDEFTLRFLRYFNTFFLDYKLIIADGAKNKINSKILEQININKNIYYFKNINDDVFERLRRSSKLVKTEYLKIIANDDFPIKYTIENCVKFLEKNKNYSVAGGFLINFLIKKKIYGKLYSLDKIYNFTSLSDNNIYKRVIKYSKFFFSNTHFVLRSKTLINSINLIFNKFDNNILLKETFFEFINVFSGKIKILKKPITMHQNHNDNNNEGSKRPNVIDVLCSKNFLADLFRFNKELNAIFKYKNSIPFDRLLFEGEIIKDLKNLNIYNYFGIKKIFRIIIDLIKIKFKENYIDNFYYFTKKINNNKIKKEILNLQNFLLQKN
jgi:glycosyltransferase domain-containing protein